MLHCYSYMVIPEGMTNNQIGQFIFVAVPSQIHALGRLVLPFHTAGLSLKSSFYGTDCLLWSVCPGHAPQWNINIQMHRSLTAHQERVLLASVWATAQEFLPMSFAVIYKRVLSAWPYRGHGYVPLRFGGTSL